jgi:hypothetical protein
MTKLFSLNLRLPLAGALSAIALLASGCTDKAGQETAAAEQAPACDRACLLKLTDDYVAAIAKHDPKAVPFADNAKFVENVTKMKVGEGVWTTATGGATQFSVHVPDERNQTAGWIGMISNKGEPAMLAVRLKLEDGKIVEAEHLVTPIRKEQMDKVQTPRPGLLADVPEAGRMGHDDLIKIGASYYDALDDNDGTKMPFAADCERHENGMITASSTDVGPGPNGAGKPNPHPTAHDCAGQLSSGVMAYITSIGNRRVFAADPVTGLVMGLSQFHHPMDFEPYPVKAIDGTVTMYDTKRMPFKPFDLPAAHIFKIGADHKVHEIEAMGFMAPLNAPSGWDEN